MKEEGVDASSSALGSVAIQVVNSPTELHFFSDDSVGACGPCSMVRIRASSASVQIGGHPSAEPLVMETGATEGAMLEGTCWAGRAPHKTSAIRVFSYAITELSARLSPHSSKQPKEALFSWNIPLLAERNPANSLSHNEFFFAALEP